MHVCIETHELVGTQTSGVTVNGYMNCILKVPRAIMEDSIAATRTTITKKLSYLVTYGTVIFLFIL